MANPEGLLPQMNLLSVAQYLFGITKLHASRHDWTDLG